MRRFLPNGQRISGLAGDHGVVAFDGVPLLGPSAGGVQPFSAHEALCQVYGALGEIRTVAINAAGAMRDLYVGPTDHRVGGGGKWAVVAPGVMQASWGPLGPANGYPLAFGPDGSFAAEITPAGGMTIDGVEVTNAKVDPRTLKVFSADRAIWGAQRGIVQWKGNDSLFVLTLPEAYWPSGEIVEGVLWVVYHDEQRRVVLHPEGTLDGYVVDVGGDHFWIDVRWVSAQRKFRVVWATHESEQPHELREAWIDPLAPRVPLAVTQNPGPITPIPVPVEPPMSLPESLAADVARVRARVNGLPTPEQLGQMLNEVAWKHREKGWGLSRKNGGNRVPFPGGGTIAADILHHKPSDTLWDCFNAATGEGATATATWMQTEHHHDPDRPWVAPVAPSGADDDPGDTNPPPPVPSPVPDLELIKRVESLEKRLQRLENAGLVVAQVYRP